MNIKGYMKIGNITLKNNLILAPMAGFSDVGMRALCKYYGAGLTVTEMVSAKGLCYGNQNTRELLVTHPLEDVKCVQIFGSEPDIIERAVSCEELSLFDIIDINMGCPVPKIVKNNEGSALMRDADLVYKIVKSAVNGANGRPITAKIRAGFENGNYTAVEVAQAIESAGGSMVTVHGRTREMYYSGFADLKIIAEVKSNVKTIPIIGNGDIVDYQSYTKMLQTGVDGVAIGRGAIGKPHIFAELLHNEPIVTDVYALITQHIDILLQTMPEKLVVNNMKKQIAHYLKGMRGNKQIREKVFYATSIEQLKSILNSNLDSNLDS